MLLAITNLIITISILGVGVRPINENDCPDSHPIKGNYTTYDGSKCIAHLPGGLYYSRTKPEFCFASIADAKASGCRISMR